MEERTRITDEAVEKVAGLMERFWNDVAGLPWRDKNWFGNQVTRESTKNHYVMATTQDVTEVMIDMFKKLGDSYAPDSSQDSK